MRVAFALALAVAFRHAVAATPKFTWTFKPGFIGAGGDVVPCEPAASVDTAKAKCASMPRCRAITFHGSENATGPIAKMYYKQSTGVGGDKSWSSFVKVFPVTPPAATLVVGGTSELAVELREGSFTVQSLNHTKANVPYSFARPLDADSAPPLAAHLGDISLRLRPAPGRIAGAESGSAAGPWSTFDSTFLGDAVAVAPASPAVLAAHDITAIVAASTDTAGGSMSFPLRVVRSYERTADGAGLVIRFNLTNKGAAPVEVGGLGFAMPEAPGHPPKGIETTVWNDPHVGLDHGFVEFVRVVDDEKTLLVVPVSTGSDIGGDAGAGNFISVGSSRSSGAASERTVTNRRASAPLEAWRPMLEDLGGSSAWEWVVHSKAWAEDWAKTAQHPFMAMPASTHGTPDMFPHAKTPWPSTDGHEGVPVLPEASFPWNPPTSAVLESGETRSCALRFQLTAGGPRTRNALLAAIGEPVVHGVPGFVLSSSMTGARLLVKPPAGAHVASVTAATSGVGDGTVSVGAAGRAVGSNGAFVPFGVRCSGRGRARVTLTYTDGSVSSVHYYCLPPFEHQAAALGRHYANDAWLPLEFPDPFGRSASVMPWDREARAHVLNDARAYDVGLSDDAGGGNPLGMASKVRASPLQDEVSRVDDFIHHTLWGVKKGVAKPPYKSLQVGGDPDFPCKGAPCDGIRMTMFYYSSDLSSNTSGHFDWNYTEADKCALPFGGPTWCMTENMANATYRGFNYPHHTASYWAMYTVARHHDKITTHRDWTWYLWRAVRTSIRATGGAGTGYMDGTVFREVLRAIQTEVAANASLTLGPDEENATALMETLDSNNRKRQENWARQPYPYGSEFGFDTTGQEEVVVWNLWYGNMTAAKRTVDHVLSYMRSMPTWAYNGGSRSWGDAGNNAKWLGAFGTGFNDRGQMHYRSGLNQIPLIEWYRQNPDDLFCLEVAMGAIAGQLTNIDETGAPSMMWWALPHMMTHDPHSGDFGLGFFGHSLESGAYYVASSELGELCYLCDVTPAKNRVNTDDGGGGDGGEGHGVVITPTDSYHRQLFVEPLALHVIFEAGTIDSVLLDLVAKRAVVTLGATATSSVTRVVLDKTSPARPGTGFGVAGAAHVRGAFEQPASKPIMTISWE